MALSDFDSIISKEIMPDELKTLRSDEESEYLSVEVKELLLRGNLSSSKFLFQELHKFFVFLEWLWDLRISERVTWDFKAWWLCLIDVLY